MTTKQDRTKHIRASAETIRAHLGGSWREIGALANRHTLAVQGWLSTRAPQAKRFEGTGITAGSSGLQPSFLNLALCSQFLPETDNEVIEDEIEAVKAFFAGRGVPWTWLLSPFCQPADMSRRLEQHGLSRYDYLLPVMVAPLPAKFPPLKDNIHIWQAHCRADLEAASAIRRIAFGFPKGSALTYFEDMAEDWLRGDPARLYLARMGDDGPPAAIGALIMAAGYPGVYVMATLPEWQGRGLGKAILAHILLRAAAEGHRRIILTAGREAYFLYRQFGFEHIFEYGMYFSAD